MTRARLLAEASPREIEEWRAFSAMEGLPQDRADLRMGILAAHAAALKGVKGVKPADFIPDWDRDPEAQEDDPDEVQRQVIQGMKMAALYGGVIQPARPKE